MKKKLLAFGEMLCGIFTPARLKKFAAVATVAAICAGGGAYFLHQQKQAQKILAAKAQTTVLTNLAREKNIALVDENTVRNTVANLIGVDAQAITYKSIRLKERDKSADFQPVYKVSCVANSVKYKLCIDAVSGNVVNVKIS